MKIKDYQCKCGHNDFFFAEQGNQKGIYCSYCGKWLKWADKDERNLAVKHESVLNKIRSEIEALPKTYPFINHIDTYVKEDDVRQIIDKYRVESEE